MMLILEVEKLLVLTISSPTWIAELGTVSFDYVILNECPIIVCPNKEGDFESIFRGYTGCASLRRCKYDMFLTEELIELWIGATMDSITRTDTGMSSPDIVSMSTVATPSS